MVQYSGTNTYTLYPVHIHTFICTPAHCTIYNCKLHTVHLITAHSSHTVSLHTFNITSTHFELYTHTLHTAHCTLAYCTLYTILFTQHAHRNFHTKHLHHLYSAPVQCTWHPRHLHTVQCTPAQCTQSYIIYLSQLQKKCQQKRGADVSVSHKMFAQLLQSLLLHQLQAKLLSVPREQLSPLTPTD